MKKILRNFLDRRFNKVEFFVRLFIIIKTLFLVIFLKKVNSKSQEIMPEFMGTNTNKIDDYKN